MYVKEHGLVRCVRVPGRHRTSGSHPGENNSLKPMWPAAFQSTSMIIHGTSPLSGSCWPHTGSYYVNDVYTLTMTSENTSLGPAHSMKQRLGV